MRAGFTRGAYWTFLRQKYRPDYLAEPKPDIRYSMPEFREYIRIRQPYNPYLTEGKSGVAQASQTV